MAVMDGQACPCGLGDNYDSCCGRLHKGEPARTAEQLMRSRYSAFAVGDDTDGAVRFRAMYTVDGQRGVLAETSRFVREDGNWLYLGPVS